MKPVILTSDILIFFLVICISLFIFSLRKNAINRDKWRSVFSQKLGISTFIIIFSYVFVALIDSVHFRKALEPLPGSESSEVYYSNEVYSLLDVVLNDMGERQESTYSAPFALKAWVKKNIAQSDGTTVRDYPELEYAGRHLESPGDKALDIFIQSFIGILKGIILSFAIGLFVYFVFLRGAKDSPIPWRTGFYTLICVLALLGWLVHMSSHYHVLGTDLAGNDTLYESLKGIRTAVLIGALVTLIALPIAVSLGISAGYFKGWVDDVVQYLYTTLSSIPGLLLIAASVLLFQVWIDNSSQVFEVGLEKADAKFIGLCFILGVTSWATLCRLVRAETLKISQLDYVNAAHAFGVSHLRILARHILPSVTHIILITFVLDFSFTILAEVILSFIGVGIDPAMGSWGNMINLARSELSREPAIWWNLSGAFFLMFVLVMASNLFSDLVNDAFNPKAQLEVA